MTSMGWYCSTLYHKARPWMLPTTASSWTTTFVQQYGGSDQTCCLRAPSSCTTMRGVTPLPLSGTFSAAGDGRYWNMRPTPRIWVHVTSTCSLKSKNLSGVNVSWQEIIIRAVGRSIQAINRSGRADGVRWLPEVWQNVINKGGQSL